MITDDQRKEWALSGKCHVCGKDTPHGHPGWMWLANPNKWVKPGKLTEGDILDVYEREKKIAEECGIRPMSLESVRKLAQTI